VFLGGGGDHVVPTPPFAVEVASKRRSPGYPQNATSTEMVRPAPGSRSLVTRLDFIPQLESRRVASRSLSGHGVLLFEHELIAVWVETVEDAGVEGILRSGPRTTLLLGD
jgi:hypothetical protein